MTGRDDAVTATGRPGAGIRSGSDLLGEGRLGRAVLLVLLALAVVVQLVVLYSPSGPGGPLFPHADKVAHVLVFLAPTTLALLAGLRPGAVVLVLAGHAVLSEVVQGVVLPTRSGDPADVLADLVGVALGVLVWRVGRRAAAQRQG